MIAFAASVVDAGSATLQRRHGPSVLEMGNLVQRWVFADCKVPVSPQKAAPEEGQSKSTGPECTCPLALCKMFDLGGAFLEPSPSPANGKEKKVRLGTALEMNPERNELPELLLDACLSCGVPNLRQPSPQETPPARKDGNEGSGSNADFSLADGLKFPLVSCSCSCCQQAESSRQLPLFGRSCASRKQKKMRL